MDAITAKEVKVSEFFDIDITDVYSYGEETFGTMAAKSFIADIYSHVWSLDVSYLTYPECKHLTSKNKLYRNIILGSYLIIYRITAQRIEVLRILRAECSVKQIRSARSIKL
jgi:plasmid stabilization system protein ParE